MAHWIVDTAGIGSLIVFLVAGPVSDRLYCDDALDRDRAA